MKYYRLVLLSLLFVFSTFAVSAQKVELSFPTSDSLKIAIAEEAKNAGNVIAKPKLEGVLTIETPGLARDNKPVGSLEGKIENKGGSDWIVLETEDVIFRFQYAGFSKMVLYFGGVGGMVTYNIAGGKGYMIIIGDHKN